MKTQQTFSERLICTRAIVGFFAAMTFCALFFEAGRAMAAEIKLIASANAAMRNALTELAPQFERSTGHKVTMDFASAVPLKRRIEAGEAFDVAIFPGVDELVKQGKVAAGTRTAFVRSGLGIGVHKGAPKPDISSVDAFKRTLLNAKSVGYGPDSEPGVQFLEVLDRLGIAQDMRPRLKAYRGGITEMGAALQKREVEMVFSSTTNLLEAATVIDFAGSLPSGIQRYIAHVAGISATTKEPEAAKALLGFLMLPTATSVFKAKGFERE